MADQYDNYKGVPFVIKTYQDSHFLKRQCSGRTEGLPV